MTMKSRMRRKALVVVAVVALAALASVGGVALSQTGNGGVGIPSVAASGALSLAQARAANFPVYYAGDSVEGYGLNVILRGYNQSPIDDVDFVYGTCTPKSDQGCPAPIEVQAWPACARSLSSYTGSVASLREDTTVRGVPGAFFSNGERLEIQTGTTTLVIFASGRRQALRVAASLRGLNGGVGAGKPLPAPAAGAVEGKLAC
jgi:hypothetical protein